jgi:drug/metabolite transporter (DMT)-like permease
MNAAPPRSSAKAAAMLVLATPCWALSFPVMKALALEQQKLLPQTNTWFFSSLDVVLRFAFAGIFIVPFLFLDKGKISRREMEQGIFLALFGGAGILFQMDGLNYTLASTSAFLTQGYTFFIPVWIALTTRRWPSVKIFLSVTLVIMGIALLANLNWHSLKLGRGETETILASLLFTGQILLLENPRYTANRPLHFSVIMFFAMALFSLPLVAATAPNFSACIQIFSSGAAIGLMAVLILICTVAGYCLMNYWQRRVPATQAGLIYCIEPVCASIMALFLPAWFSVWAKIDYPNEELTSRLIVGGILVTIANILLQSNFLEPKKLKHFASAK